MKLTPPEVTTSFKDHVFCQGMTVDAKHPTTIYLCICAFDAKKGGLHKSTDSGATWKVITAGLPSGGDERATDVVIDPSNPDVDPGWDL